MTTYITDQSVIASYNRGPITDGFSPPASCTATLVKDDTTTYFGHFLGYYRAECYPTGTRGVWQLASAEEWGTYYC